MKHIISHTIKLWSMRGTKFLAVIVLAAVASWQILPPFYAEAVVTTDLPIAITSSPALYGNLITANANVTSALSQINAAGVTLAATTNTFNVMQSNLIVTAMNQGVGAVITFDQITDPTQIDQKEAGRLVMASLGELAAAGLVVPQTLSNPSQISSSTVDLIIEAAMVDLGIDPGELKRGRGYYTYPDPMSGAARTDPMILSQAIDNYWAIVQAARTAIAGISGPVTLGTIKTAVASSFLGSLSAMFGVGPTICPGAVVTAGAAFCSLGLVPFPGSVADMEAFMGVNFDPAFIAGSNEGLQAKVVADIIASTGYFDIAAYKTLFANSISSVTGIPGGPAAVSAVLGAGSMTALRTTIKNSIEKTILGKIGSIQNGISPTSIQGAVGRVLASVIDPTAINVRNYATNVVNGAIASGGVSLTQVQNLFKVETPDVQRIVTAAFADTGLAATLSLVDQRTIIDNTITKFATTQGVISVADINTLVATQINFVASGSTVAGLVAGMSGGTTRVALEGAMKNMMVSNVTTQLGSAAALLDTAKIKEIMSSSIISATGIGNLANIDTVVTGLGAGALATFQTGLQGVYSGQTALLTAKMNTLLDPTKIQNMIGAQMTTLTGLGSITSVEALINNSLGGALTSMAQTGAQLSAITKSYENALGSVKIAMVSLTGTFNGTLASMSMATQLNLSTMTTGMTTMVGNLSAQITGPMSATVTGMSGTVTNITSTGSASAADMTSMSSSNSSMTTSNSTASSNASGSSSSGSNTTSSSGMTQIPFGGNITYVVYCTCSAGMLLTVAGPIPGVFYYSTVGSILYPNYQIYRTGPSVIGLASQTPGQCWVIATPCYVVGAGPVITQIGTSL